MKSCSKRLIGLNPQQILSAKGGYMNNGSRVPSGLHEIANQREAPGVTFSSKQKRARGSITREMSQTTHFTRKATHFVRNGWALRKGR